MFNFKDIFPTMRFPKTTPPSTPALLAIKLEHNTTIQVLIHKTTIKKYHICISNTAPVVLLVAAKANLAVFEYPPTVADR